MKVYKLLKMYKEKLNEKEKYFIEYFDFKSTQYLNVSDDFSVLNPNVIVDLIIEELNENNNARNLKFFKDKLGEFLKVDNVLKERYGEITKKILEYISFDKVFTLELCKELKNEFKNGKYAKLCYKRLMEVLKTDSTLEDTKTEINYLTRVIIIELAIYGYSPKKISEIIIEMAFFVQDFHFLRT